MAQGNAAIVTYASTDVNGAYDTAPDRFQILTGTVSSNGRVVTGTGTLFTTEIGGGLYQIGLPTVVEEGGWLFNGINEVRQIQAINTDTSLVLEDAFTIPLGNSIVRYVQPSRAKQMSLVALAAGAIVNGNTLQNAEGTGWGDTSSVNHRTVDPVVINSSAASVRVTITRTN